MAENESILDRQVNPDPPKDNRRKLKVTFIAIVLVGFGALVGNGLYNYYRAVNSVSDYEKAYNARIESERAVKMADTYGGKAPAETLALYIDAVKKGDYELASKYLVNQHRDAEYKKLIEFEDNKLKSYLINLEIIVKSVLAGNGSYTENKTELIVDKPFFADFELYPNGIWKIIEI